MTLPGDHAERKRTPIYSAVLRFFPLAIAALARHSLSENERHAGKGSPIKWVRSASPDHPDCIARHLTDYAMGDKAAMVAIMWRAAAQVQLDEEERLGAEKIEGLGRAIESVALEINRDPQPIQTRPPEQRFRRDDGAGMVIEHGVSPADLSRCICGADLFNNPRHLDDVRSMSRVSRPRTT